MSVSISNGKEKNKYFPYKDNIFIKYHQSVELFENRNIYVDKWFISRKIDKLYTGNVKAHEYLHKNFIWKSTCGLKAMWNSFEEAEAHLLQYFYGELITEEEMEV